MLTLEKRLEKLEKKLRIYQFAFMAIILAGGFLVITAFNKKVPVPDLIQAKEFQVVDDQGKTFISLKKDYDAGSIKVYNTEGTALIDLYSTAGTGAILTKTQTGKFACYIGAYNTGAAYIKIYNINEKAVDEIGSTSNDYGYVGVNNTNEDNILSITTTSYGDGIVSVYNRYKNRICVLGPDNYGNGLLNILNSSGQNMNGIWPK
jgi:hypothetical protein